MTIETILQQGLAPLVITGGQLQKFRLYFEMLTDWNTRVNLTTITNETEVAQKHFLDSLAPLQHGLLPQGAHLIDVGTGAGFPGIPLAIMRPDISLALLDSVNKRLLFLQEVCTQLTIKAQIIHARAEDGAHNPLLRQQFDIATARAVAALPTLLELLLPFLKVGGNALCYKGPAAKEELLSAQNALRVLGGASPKLFLSNFPNFDAFHLLVCVQKSRSTPKLYPRKAGTPAKDPIL